MACATKWPATQCLILRTFLSARCEDRQLRCSCSGNSAESSLSIAVPRRSCRRRRACASTATLTGPTVTCSVPQPHSATQPKLSCTASKPFFSHMAVTPEGHCCHRLVAKELQLEIYDKNSP